MDVPAGVSADDRSSFAMPCRSRKERCPAAADEVLKNVTQSSRAEAPTSAPITTRQTIFALGIVKRPPHNDAHVRLSTKYQSPGQPSTKADLIRTYEYPLQLPKRRVDSLSTLPLAATTGRSLPTHLSRDVSLLPRVPLGRRQSTVLLRLLARPSSVSTRPQSDPGVPTSVAVGSAGGAGPHGLADWPVSFGDPKVLSALSLARKCDMPSRSRRRGALTGAQSPWRNASSWSGGR